MNNKIGVGLVTYNAEDRIKCSAPTVPTGIDKFVIVNDGTPYKSEAYPSGVEVITHSKNLGVGIAKNTAMRTLLQSGCEHIFIMEDDISIKNPNVFDEYIRHAKKTGLYHLMYGYHGPANMKGHPHGIPPPIPNPRTVIEYTDDIKIALNLHCVGAFCYYHKGVLKNVGYNDEMYKNAWEHVDHSYRIVKLGLLPAYWWWPDISTSNDYLTDNDPQSITSQNGKSEEWQKNFVRGAEYFKMMHQHYPTKIPDTSPADLVKNLKRIAENYGSK
jgi:GT2 family glycosyltransferase